MNEWYTVQQFASHDRCDANGYWQQFVAMNSADQCVAIWNTDRIIRLIDRFAIVEPTAMRLVLERRVLATSGLHALRLFREWQQKGLDDSVLTRGGAQ